MKNRTSFLRDSFFLEIHDNIAIPLIYSFEVENALVSIASTDSYFIKFARSNLKISDTLESSLLELFSLFDEKNNSVDSVLGNLSFQIMVIDERENKIKYITCDMPNIQIVNIENRLIELEGNARVFDMIKKQEILYITYPLSQISKILLSTNRISQVPFSRDFNNIFSKKDLISQLDEIGEDIIDLSNDLSFLLCNANIGKDIELNRVYKIDAKISNIENIERELESLLESYFDNATLNAKTILTINELLLNAYEHGVLRIDGKKKQELMEEGLYDDHLLRVEQGNVGVIEVCITFYKSGILKVSIDDFGDGFDLETLKLPAKSEYRGRGISMSYNIVNSLFFQNNGSRAIFFVNYSNTNDMEDISLNISGEELVKSLKVLYVEDDKIIRDIFTTLIKNRIKILYSAKDGNEGLNKFQKYHPDVVITDVNMPYMNGIELCRAIKKISPQTPVIFTTAYHNHGLIYDSLEVGVDKFLAKPIDILKLKNALFQVSKKLHIKAKKESNKRYEYNIYSLREKTLSSMAEEKLASKKQKLIIRDEKELIENLKIESFYRPVEILGGDSYGVCKLDENFSLFYLIDAMGSGIVASTTAVLSSSFINRSIDISKKRDGFVLERLVKDYMEFIDNYMLEDEILSFTFFLLDSSKNEISYINYGNFPPLLDDFSGEIFELKGSNSPFRKGDSSALILRRRVDSRSYRVLLSTSGVAQSENFGYRDLLKSFHKHSDFPKLLEDIKSNLSVYRKLQNDMTMIYISKES